MHVVRRRPPNRSPRYSLRLLISYWRREIKTRYNWPGSGDHPPLMIRPPSNVSGWSAKVKPFAINMPILSEWWWEHHIAILTFATSATTATTATTATSATTTATACMPGIGCCSSEAFCRWYPSGEPTVNWNPIMKHGRVIRIRDRLRRLRRDESALLSSLPRQTNNNQNKYPAALHRDWFDSGLWLFQSNPPPFVTLFRYNSHSFRQWCGNHLQRIRASVATPTLLLNDESDSC